jgi:purine-nucleoside phosphorylase
VPSTDAEPFGLATHAAAVLAARTGVDLHDVAVVLGSGWSRAAAELGDGPSVALADVPGFPAPSVAGHGTAVRSVEIGGRRILVFLGRVHLYEGHDLQTVTFAIRAMAAFGVRTVILTNAAGGLDPAFGPGTLMVISDHLNLTGQNPLVGPNAPGVGERFTDMTDAWSPRLRGRLHAAGNAEGVPLAEGVYVGLMGPNYETPAEVRLFASFGGQAVGMSTVMECVAARWAGLEVCGVSLVTNAGAGYTGEPLTHEEVLAAGAEAGPRLARVIRRFVADLEA